MSTNASDFDKLWGTTPGRRITAAPDFDALWGDDEDEGPGLLERAASVGKQALAGAVESIGATAEGAARLLPYTNPVTAGRSVAARLLNGEPSAEDRTAAQVADAAERVAGRVAGALAPAPQSTEEKVGRIGGRLVADVAQFMVPGAAAGKVAAAPRLLPRLGLNVATSAPITAAQAMSGEDNSTTGALAAVTDNTLLDRIARNPVTRVAGDLALDVAGAGLVEAGAAGLRSARRALDVGEDVSAGIRSLDAVDAAPPVSPDTPDDLLTAAELSRGRERIRLDTRPDGAAVTPQQQATRARLTAPERARSFDEMWEADERAARLAGDALPERAVDLSVDTPPVPGGPLEVVEGYRPKTPEPPLPERAYDPPPLRPAQPAPPTPAAFTPEQLRLLARLTSPERMRAFQEAEALRQRAARLAGDEIPGGTLLREEVPTAAGPLEVVEGFRPKRTPNVGEVLPEPVRAAEAPPEPVDLMNVDLDALIGGPARGANSFTSGLDEVAPKVKTKRRESYFDISPRGAGQVFHSARRGAREMPDDDLYAAWRKAIRQAIHTSAEAAGSEGKQSRVFDNLGTKGVAATGKGAFARGRLTQADHRVAAYGNELTARGLPVPDEAEAFMDAARDDLPASLHGLYDRLPKMEDDEVLSLLDDLERRPLHDVNAMVSRGLLGAAAKQRGLLAGAWEAGSAAPEAVSALARTGTGAAAGAALDEEDRTRGAMLGAAAGAGAPAAVRGLRSMGERGSLGFYSRLEKAIETAPFEKGTAEQWLARLDKAPGGVANGEREWVGVDAYLRERAGQPVTRREILDHVAANRINVGETVLGARSTAYEARVRDLNARLRELQNEYGETLPQHAQEARRINREFAELNANPERNGLAKYAERTEPGGENYREILLTLGNDAPVSAPEIERLTALPEGYDVVVDRSMPEGQQFAITPPGQMHARPMAGRHPTPKAAEAEALEILNRQRQQVALDEARRRTEESQFKSSHFDQPNILAHARVTDRTLPNGERVLFVEEVQSDWHQAGRRKGYRGDVDRDLERVTREREALHQEWESARAAGRPLGPEREADLYDRMNALHDREDELRRTLDPVPDAPFKKTEEWVGLAMKRLIDEAVEGGYDRVAWTTGAQQAARYDLSKQVSGLRYNPETQHLQALTLDGAPALDGTYAPGQLPDVVGKEAAERLLAQRPASTGYVNLAGDGLRVGGEGMKAFYDRMLPNWVKDYAKKMGVALEVEPVALDEMAQRPEVEFPKGTRTVEFDDGDAAMVTDGLQFGYLYKDGSTDWLGTSPRDLGDGVSRSDFKHINEFEIPEPQAPGNLSFRVTSDLRERVRSGGQPLYANPFADPALIREAMQSAGGRAVAGAGAGAAVDGAEGDDSVLDGAAIGAAAAAGGPTALRRLRAAGEEGFVGVDEATRGATEALQPAAQAAPRSVTPAGIDAAQRFAKNPPAPVDPAAAARVNPDEHVNVAKFALDPSGEERLRAEVQSVAARHGLDPKKTVTWDETRATAEKLGLKIDGLSMAKGADRLSGAEMLAIRNVVSGNLDELERAAKALADPALTPMERETLERTVSAIDAQNDALLSRFIRSRSQAGRDLNSMKILANRTLDPTVWLAKAKSLAGADGFTDGVRADVLGFINRGDRAGLVQFMAGLRRSTVQEKGVTLWKAGLLTNPKTHAVNLTGNTTMAALETFKDNPAAVVDWMLSRATGLRTKHRTTTAALVASAQGAKKGLAEAKLVMKGVPLDDALRRFDIPHEVNFDNAFLDTYTKTVFRSLGATDRIFKGAALRRSLAEQATILAKAEGLKGEALNTRVAELVQTPSDEMALRALRDAEEATFQDSTRLGRWLGAAGREMGTIGHVVVPFSRTPGSVATKVAEYSPLGVGLGMREVWKLWRAATRGADVGELAELQRRAATVLGRSATGAAPIVLGYLLAQAGLATGAFPLMDKEERDQWMLDGRQENAVLIGGHWQNVGRLSPLGNLVALGANMAKAMESDAGLIERAGQTAFAGLRTVADQPFLQGITDLKEALAEPDKASAYVERLAGSAVPAGVAAVARGVDPTIRETEGLGEAVAARLPGLSRTLSPKMGALGEERTREEGLLDQGLNPLSPSENRAATDPLVGELSRIGVGLGRLKAERVTAYVDTEGKVRFKREALDDVDAANERQRLFGQALRQELESAMTSPEYAAADDVARKEGIEEIVSQLRRDFAAWERENAAALLQQ